MGPSFDALMASLDHEPPLFIRRRKGESAKIARRRTNNQLFKERASSRKRMWAKPTLLRKQFEARLRFRHQRTERAPHRLAYAVMIPLIRRYRQQRGPMPEHHRVPENDFDFWIHWLHWFSLAAIPEAAGFLKANYSIERTLSEPIQRLIQALTDCRDGVRSRYTEAFFCKTREAWQGSRYQRDRKA